MTFVLKSVLRAEFPDNFPWKDSVTILHPSGDANLIFSSEPVTDQTIESYARVQKELLASEFSGYQETRSEPGTVFGVVDGWIHGFQWAPPDNEPVQQWQYYAVLGGRGYTATATVRFGAIELEPEMLVLLSQLTIGD